MKSRGEYGLQAVDDKVLNGIVELYSRLGLLD